MTLIETMTLPAESASCWRLLVEENQALQLTPGLAPGPDGRGTLRIVLGAHSVSYRGYARTHIEEEGRHLTWTLSGKEMRGTGRAHAEIRARFHDQPDGTTALRLTVLVDGRGKLSEFSEEELEAAASAVIARFRRAVARELAGAPREESAASEPIPGEKPRAARTPTAVPAGARIEIVPAQPPPGRSWAVPILVGGSGAVGIGILILVRSRIRR